VNSQPGGLVGEQTEGGRVGLREAEARKALDLGPDRFGGLSRDAALAGSVDEALVVGVDRRLGALAAHRPPQSLGLRGGEARERHRHLDYLLLEDDRPQRLLQDRLQQRMRVGHLEARILAQGLTALNVGVDGAALDRAGADQGDLDGEVIEVAWLGAGKYLHLRPALDLKDAGRLRRADRDEGLLVIERNAREVDRFAAHALDLDHRALYRREHPEPEEVDLQQAGVPARVLVPLEDLAAGHRRRHDRAEVDQRSGGDHHPAGVLGGVTRQTHDVLREPQQRLPARRAGPLGADRGDHVGLHLAGLAVVAEGTGDRLDLLGGHAQDLAEVTHRALGAVGREGGDQGRVLGAVALMHAGDQHFADVAGEVDVDVGQRCRFHVEKATGEELGLDRVDVGEAGQVADDRADA